MKLNKTLVSGSLILLITFNLFNALNFIFQFSMARLLSVVEYGVLATLFSFIYIMSIFTESIQMVIVKYAAAEKNDGKVKNLLRKSLQKAFFASMFLFICYALIALFLTKALEIPYSLLLLNGVFIFSSLLLPVNRGLMLGKKMFGMLGVSLLVEAVLKLGLGITFVFLGWKVFGALLGTLIGTFASFFFSFIPLQSIFKSREKKAQTSGIYTYTTPVFIITATILAFYSLDILVAKAVFDAQTAGHYAIASVLAKTLFLATQPISKAMFPLSVTGKKKSGSRLLYEALAFLSACILAVCLVAYFFPGFLITLFSGKTIAESAHILFPLTLGVGILSLANLVLWYKISKGMVSRAGYLPLIVGIEFMFLWLFSKTLEQFSLAFVAAAAIFLLASAVLAKR